ncbi:MAG: hypothetical protein EAZ32_06225 [Cytophagia bacterium]|nr:MAG: hypothetical protein EAZ32_06225 [Cytophagia bacterium]
MSATTTSIVINYDPAAKRFLTPYTYLATRKKIPRSVNPFARSYRSLVIQVLRARRRGVVGFSWNKTVANPVFSLEGNFNECALYRFSDTGTLLTIVSGTFIDVLRQLHMIAQAGIPLHQAAAKDANFNISLQEVPAP